MVRKIGLGAVLIVLVLMGTLTFRTLFCPSRQVAPEPFQPVPVDGDAAVAHFAKALQFATISYEDERRDSEEAFAAFHKHLEACFPSVHATLNREKVNDWTLLYRWRGRDPKRAPVLFLAHQDVVAASEETRDQWEEAPFSGLVKDGVVWGRGAVDDKGSLMALLEAAEALIDAGFTPERDMYFCLGHDEEIGGPKGAAAVAALLKERGVHCEFSLDEGLVITDGIIPGVAYPVALVAIAEKGYLTAELKVTVRGGHSSQPPKETAIGILAKAIQRLESNPMPAHFSGPVRLTFEYAAPEMALPLRALFANLWLFEGVVQGQLEAVPAMNAGLRTTMAPTIIQAGYKQNVLPHEAAAVVNFRILPGDTIDSVLEHVQKTIDDERVVVTPTHRETEASPVSDHEGPAYRLIAESIRQVWPEVAVAPSLQIGGTDSKHFPDLCDNLYRFTPFFFANDDLSMIHGVNERLEVKRYLEAIQFYALVMQHAQS